MVKDTSVYHSLIVRVGFECCRMRLDRNRTFTPAEAIVCLSAGRKIEDEGGKRMPSRDELRWMSAIVESGSMAIAKCCSNLSRKDELEASDIHQLPTLARPEQKSWRGLHLRLLLRLTRDWCLNINDQLLISRNRNTIDSSSDCSTIRDASSEVLIHIQQS